MLCNWLSLASNVIRISHSTRTYNIGRLPIAVHRLRARTFADVMHSPPKVYPPLDATLQLPLTNAQMSRATTRAIHQCLQPHSLADAYYILNSLRYSNFRHQKSLVKFSGVRSVQHFKDTAVQFACPISARLSSHALLHGLLRIGLSKKAYRLVRLMINDGINVRSKTLQVVMQSLYPPLPAKFCPASPVRTAPVLHLGMARDPGTRMAISLLMAARKSWNKRTRSMYKTLLALCILNGEIILGSLLFGYMIRHWKSHMAEKASANQLMSSPATSDTNVKRGPKHFTPYHLRDRWLPSATMLQPLLEGINANLEHKNADEGSVQAALQALANLANLLDQGGLPFSNLSLLLRILSGTPKADHYVWVMEEGNASNRFQPVLRRRDAHKYFRHVLRRLINDLPSNTNLKYRPGQQVTPALDLESYNTLLRYALRLSPNVGNAVLNHMINERCRGLKPDIVTYNIIIRLSTIKRDFHMVERALSLLRRNPKNHILVSVMPDEVARGVPKSAVQDQEAIWVEEIAPEDIPEVNNRTLYAYIGYLVAIGQPGKAATLFTFLVPELRECRRYLPPDQRSALREAYLRKAVMLGPRIFTAILTALYKGGKWGVAERVWLIALAAEEASHDPKYGSPSWSLPVEAYTVMIQCYGAQIHRYDRVVGWGRLLDRGERTVTSQRRLAAYRLAGHTYEVARSRLEGQELNVEFFRAALLTFSRAIEPTVVRRGEWRRLQRAQREYVRSGTPAPSNPMMIQVAQDTLNAGYALPATYRYLLVGHISPIELAAQARPLRYNRYRRPRPTNGGPLCIPTVKHLKLPRRSRARARHHRGNPYPHPSHVSCQTS